MVSKWKVLRRSLLLSSLFLFCIIPTASAQFWDLSGDTMLHDPSITKEGNTWWAFGTGEVNKNGIRVMVSNNGSYWSPTPVIFPSPLSWWKNYVPTHETNQWAPDIQYYNGRYWLFYSVSSFGSKNSLIGLTSTTSIQSGNWRDDGLVIRSTMNNNFNAIDGDLVIDVSGEPWLSFGSFWSGIKLVKLDKYTMKPTGNIHSIAARPNHPEHAIEAPNITYRNGYYYLFVSFDHCCQGVNSDYKIAVGRSRQVTGPYYDRNGVNMLQGGGTILDAGNERWRGPGHQDVYNNNVIVRHAYDAENNGVPRLLINDLYWDSAGWPTY